MPSSEQTSEPEFESPEFLARLKAYDPDAFRLLVEGFRDRIYNLGMKLLRNPEDAEEVLQETLLSVFDKIESFEGRSRLSTWIYAIASNGALSRLRKKGAQNVTFDEEETLNVSDGWFRNASESFNINKNDPVLLKELQDRLDRAIESLPDGYRELFVLKEIEMLPIKDIAAAAGIRPGAVKTRLHRARLMLRARLSDYWNEGQP